PGARLLHIGPHKTGTTALQGALWLARDELLRQGVRHAGPTRNPSNQVRAVVGQSSAYSDSPPPIGQWRSLVREITGAHERLVIVSSEFFAAAKPDAIRRIVHDLDPARVHVVVTLRRLDRVIPSMWQQNVQAGRTTAFEPWLEGLFREPPGRPNPAFWLLHRHDELIARWAAVVGADGVTAVVVDEDDRDRLLRTFERLVGIPEGTLALDEDLANRSLTMQEAEAVRAFNRAFEAEELPRALHARIMRFGAAQVMKRRPPTPDEDAVEMPAWAIDRARAVQREIVANVASSGVRVVGDLGRLTADPPPLRRSEASPLPEAGGTDAGPEIAAKMAIGVLLASGAARSEGMRLGRLEFAEPIELARVSTVQLGAVLVGRAKNAMVSRLRGIPFVRR
ncbi:MAG TPA: hypothetical protein VGK63_11110, partial [Candidatus Limnocylindrales bacterium]